MHLPSARSSMSGSRRDGVEHASVSGADATARSFSYHGGHALCSVRCRKLAGLQVRLCSVLCIASLPSRSFSLSSPRPPAGGRRHREPPRGAAGCRGYERSQTLAWHERAHTRMTSTRKCVREQALVALHRALFANCSESSSSRAAGSAGRRARSIAPPSRTRARAPTLARPSPGRCGVRQPSLRHVRACGGEGRGRRHGPTAASVRRVGSGRHGE